VYALDKQKGGRRLTQDQDARSRGEARKAGTTKNVSARHRTRHIPVEAPRSSLSKEGCRHHKAKRMSTGQAKRNIDAELNKKGAIIFVITKEGGKGKKKL